MKKTNFQMVFSTILLVSVLFPFLLNAQKKEGWVVDDPHGSFKTVEFETNEGTWMNLDVSPDGKEIAFDLLGDIYLMPIS
ncbi:MAG TPA: hypothetical protein ENJ82_16500, partial [Bacteroidetes bacterium]|nr:hypothetical protein [Bacteroidota bacterium]